MRIPRAFSRSECEQIIALTERLRQHVDEFLTFGEVRGASAVCWLETAKAPDWLVERVTGLLAAAVQHFFEHYKDLEDGKWVKVVGWEGMDAAHAEVMSGIANFDARSKA